MYLDILVAAVVSIFIGFLWYGPLLGNQWRKAMKITPRQMEQGKKKGMPASTYILLIIASIMTAYILKLVLLQFPFDAAKSLLITSVALWFGFMVPLMIDSVLWEGRSWKLFFINSGYRLVSLLAMTSIYLLF